MLFNGECFLKSTIQYVLKLAMSIKKKSFLLRKKAKNSVFKTYPKNKKVFDHFIFNVFHEI